MLLLILVLILVILTNYSLGTYLIGWDNLMPELNIWMNLKRSLFAVWQEYQGLGLNGGMGHATDLIRQLIILPFTLIVPNSLIRYLWHFAMLFLGTFGIYFGIKNILKFSHWIAFLSSLFYLLNFGTVQNFWAPFEPFSTFWGFFPWLIFSLWQYLKSPLEIRNLKLVIFINFLAIPSFYVPTLFIVYLLCVFIILLAHFFKSINNSSLVISNYIKLLIIIFVINSFWLLPFIYFTKNDIQNPELAIGNLMASQETVLRNQNRGYVPDFLLLRGYYYDFPDTNGFLMNPWRQHFSHPLILVIGYTLSVFVILGVIILLKNFKKNSFIKISLLGFFFISAIALLSATPPFSWINSLIRLSPLLDQIFRSPFTKFIIPAIFSFTLLFAFALNFLFNFFKKYKYSHFLLSTFYFLLVLIFSFPVFTGNFIYPQMRQKIPPEYFETFEFFKQEPPTSRIMNLPSGSFWGWHNYRFGVRGSGFIWYAIEQPILDRAFDVWNLKNEQYYWELNFAIQKLDPVLLENILKKYSISYILFDNNLFFPDEKIYAKSATPTREFLSQIPNLTLEKQLGQIYIYKYQSSPSLFTITHPANISEPGFFYKDSGFKDYSNYISISNPQIIYPFFNLFTNRPNSKNELPPLSSLIYSYSRNPYVRLETKTPNNFYARNFKNYNPSKSYVIEINYRHIKNYPLIFSAFSNDNNNIFFTTKLKPSSDWQTDWFIIPQVANETDITTGLTLLFNNTTFTDSASINDIKSIKIYTFPFDQLIETKKVITPINPSLKNPLDYFGHYFFYKTTIKTTSPNSYLVLPQSFHPGWLAFYFSGTKPIFLTNHVLVNNWSNGWFLPSSIINHESYIYIIYWPQFLEFLGFGFLVALFLYFLRHSH